MHWLWVTLIGLLVGAVAKLIMPGKDPGGFIVTMLMGVVGSFVATWSGQAIEWYGKDSRRALSCQCSVHSCSSASIT